MTEKIIAPGKLTLTVEASSPAAIEKLLEQALFELRTATLKKENFFEPQSFAESATGEQSGTMGSYGFQFKSVEVEEATDAGY